MSSRPADNQRHGTSQSKDALKRASERLKQAQADYGKFQATAPITDAPEAPRMGEMLEAQKRLLTAEEELREAYARYLQEDPGFQKRSQEIEQDLAKGLPWEDRFSPGEILRESEQREPRL